MTEQPNTQQPGDAEQAAQADEGRDVRHAGGGRTEGETAVDDALGQGEG